MMRLSVPAAVTVFTSTVSRDPPPWRLSSPRPEVNASKEEPRAARRFFVSTESAVWLDFERESNTPSQRASIVEPNPLKNDSTLAGDALPRVIARRRTSSSA